jgi:hypothetical protein
MVTSRTQSLKASKSVFHRSGAVIAVFRGEFTAEHCVRCATAVSILTIARPQEPVGSRRSQLLFHLTKQEHPVLVGSHDIQ